MCIILIIHFQFNLLRLKIVCLITSSCYLNLALKSRDSHLLWERSQHAIFQCYFKPLDLFARHHLKCQLTTTNTNFHQPTPTTNCEPTMNQPWTNHQPTIYQPSTKYCQLPTMNQLQTNHYQLSPTYTNYCQLWTNYEPTTNQPRTNHKFEYYMNFTAVAKFAMANFSTWQLRQPQCAN